MRREILLAESGGVVHILTPKDAGLGLCGFDFQEAPKEITAVDRLRDINDEEASRLCPGCRSRADGNEARDAQGAKATTNTRQSSASPKSDLSMAPQHLKHRKAQLVELKDQLLTHEISYAQFKAKAYRLQKEIQVLEETVAVKEPDLK